MTTETQGLTRILQSPMEHRGQRVITLSMMDEAHGRKSGTAGRNFRQHRARLVEGIHYFQIQGDEIRRFGERPQGGTAKSLVLLAERGYLMLAKSFTDELAWHVQDQLVESYFAQPRTVDPITALCGLLADQSRRMDRMETQLLYQQRAMKNAGRVAAFPNAYRPPRRKKKLRAVDQGALPLSAVKP